MLLLLGGTGEARRLADALAGSGRVVTSLAGRVADPVLPAGEVRVGGFGGADGLAAYLRAERVSVLVDATHPFAARISASAASAAAATGVPLLVLRRPGWSSTAGDRWHRVPSLAAAAAHLAASEHRRIFLTTGRQGLAEFAGITDRWFLVRSVDAPEPPMPPNLESLLSRGPFDVVQEVALLRQYSIDIVVTKDSGGAMTAAKLAAARSLGLPVLMVDRPPVTAGVPVVASVQDAVEHLRTLMARSDHAAG